tara:strand:- start:59 stop:274 length:216 start_codon:yes stop_codon:yes gene_type:complete
MDKIDRLVKFIREEGGMTTGSTAGKPGFSNAADAEGPVAGRDELMFAKPVKRKLGPWIKAAIKQGKKGKKK